MDTDLFGQTPAPHAAPAPVQTEPTPRALVVVADAGMIAGLAAACARAGVAHAEAGVDQLVFASHLGVVGLLNVHGNKVQ